jgi:hypothetical protein
MLPPGGRNLQMIYPDWAGLTKLKQDNQRSLSEGEGSVQLTLFQLLFIIKILFTFLQNKQPKWGGQLY